MLPSPVAHRAISPHFTQDNKQRAEKIERGGTVCDCWCTPGTHCPRCGLGHGCEARGGKHMLGCKEPLPELIHPAPPIIPSKWTGHHEHEVGNGCNCPTPPDYANTPSPA